MTSKIGVKKIQYPNGTDIITLDSSGDLSIDTDTLHVDASNNRVGIGETSPQTKLHIKTADASATADANSAVVIEGTDATRADLQFLGDATGFQAIYFGDNSDADIGRIAYDHTGNSMRFNTNASERMRIRSDGQVGIGTAGGSAQLQVLKASGDIAYFQNSSGTGAKIAAGNQSFSAVSDENKKENIVELNKQQSYDNIKNIRSVTYNFRDIDITDEEGNTTTHEDNKNRIGFIAQDWETNYSQLVDTDSDNVKSLLYTETTPVLLSALQKAQEKIEALEARVTALESE